MSVKEQHKKKNFYLPILDELKQHTNLTKIQKNLGISKQQLNYYLRRLRENGLITKKGTGWWEVKDSSKRTTQYGRILPKDFVRGHGYVITINFPKEIEGWDNRIKLLESKNYNYKLVGAMNNIPRIKVLGRKVWLCNNHIRIFEKKDKSYYGEDAVISRSRAFEEILDVVRCLENKLGINLSPYSFEFRKEHYALIKNDLAIDQNKKGIIMRIKDKDGEWLLIDDSLGMGGELETIGKKSLTTNIHLQKWWNEMKDTKFSWTPTNIGKSIYQVTKNQEMFNENFVSHVEAIKTLSSEVKRLGSEVTRLMNTISLLQNDNKHLNSFNDKKL